MKLSKEQVKLVEDLARRTEVDSGYTSLHIRRLAHIRGFAPSITSYGCGCCSSDTPLTEETLGNLISELEDAVAAAKTLKGMFDSGELNYGELLEGGEE